MFWDDAENLNIIFCNGSGRRHVIRLSPLEQAEQPLIRVRVVAGILHDEYIGDIAYEMAHQTSPIASLCCGGNFAVLFCGPDPGYFKAIETMRLICLQIFPPLIFHF